mmetsp:Transcript_42621/g.110147  ORF Transcript_42621/g.110147 Transcript_42621/m.110147 type:complete len:106 (+) Transcript_42621:48-365(+)
MSAVLLVGEGKSIFRTIMRLHRTKLPAVMRDLGNPYVRREFRLHYVPNVAEKHRTKFLAEWNNYVSTLSSQATVVGKEMEPEQLGKLNDDQKKQLGDLEREAKAL